MLAPSLTAHEKGEEIRPVKLDEPARAAGDRPSSRGGRDEDGGGARSGAGPEAEPVGRADVEHAASSSGAPPAAIPSDPPEASPGYEDQPRGSASEPDHSPDDFSDSGDDADD
jgi:hypothetical protein